MRTVSLLALFALALASRAMAAAPEPSRGELLYENHCQSCHESTLHVRTDHRARSPAEVQEWVQHWSEQQKLGWSNEDVSEVADFLVRRYYRFPPPAR